jgi:fibronectin type 3 domain-containing protein
MKTRHRLFFGFAILLVAAMFTLTGCGDNGNPSSPPGGGLSTPTDLRPTVSGTSVTLSWDAVDGADVYKIYRSTSESGPYVQITVVSTTSYTDSGLSDGMYYYKVSAVSSSGTESPQSHDASATVSGDGGLSTPTNLTAQVSGTSVNLSWDAVDGADVYFVYRSTSADGIYSYDSTTDTSLTISDLSAGTYYYKVSAVDYNEPFGTGFVQSPLSDYVSATVSSGGNQLPAPINLEVTATTASSISLAWDRVDGASQYRIFVSTDNWASYTHYSNASSESFTHSGLSSAITYYYKVAALDSNGVEGQWSASVSATVGGGGGGDDPDPDDDILTPDIDASLLGTWKDKPAFEGYGTPGDILTITFTGTTVTWGGSAGDALNTALSTYQAYGSYAWTVKDGNIDLVYIHPSLGKQSYTCYTYVINGSGELELQVSGITFATLTK